MKSCDNCSNHVMETWEESCLTCECSGLEPSNWQPLTNGDRIRRMTDTQLAIFMFSILTVDGSVADAPIFGNHIEDWETWMKKESKL